MVEIFDRTVLEAWLEKGHVRDCFDTKDLEFQAFRYEKGETITDPERTLPMLLFVVEGTVLIYGIREDGNLAPISRSDRMCILGDIEFTRPEEPGFFAQAETAVNCAALPIRRYRKELDRDVRFLHVLLNSYAEKLRMLSMTDKSFSTLEERVLLYLENVCPNGELTGMESTALSLKCSRRQLQRVLKKLCEDGQIRKTGKGRYQRA